MPRQVYVWQREWSANVVESVRERGGHFDELIVLVAEVSWTGARPTIVRVAPDWRALADIQPKTGVGLAIRVGEYGGPFEAEALPARRLKGLASEVLAEARAAGVGITELQVDFDCAERHLDGYRKWVAILREAIAPVPLTITTLPSWWKRKAFRDLVAATDGFVLQVHSLVRPRSPHDPITLCDPDAARLAVERAAEVSVETQRTFRVALPTYGYLVAFDRTGRFLGASAEGPAPGRPEGTIFRELRADPVAMTALVVDWTADRPAAMRGLVWYRLPVRGDRFNWRWPTLSAVLEGQAPVPRLGLASVQSAPGLHEIELANTGSGDYSGSVAVLVGWQGAKRIGADGILGFTVESVGAADYLFTNAICRLPAGERSRIGWVRLDAPVPITLECLTPADVESPPTGKHEPRQGPPRTP